MGHPQFATRGILQCAQVHEAVAADQQLDTAGAVAQQHTSGCGRGLGVAALNRKWYLSDFERRATGVGQFRGFHVKIPFSKWLGVLSIGNQAAGA